jgi:hypothetical protein
VPLIVVGDSRIGIFGSTRRRAAALAPLLLLALAANVGAQTVGPVNVPGTSNPFLAGMPDGSICCSGDAAPAQSPAPVMGLPLNDGASLTFVVTGSVDNAANPPTLSPDGGVTFSNSASNGIAAMSNMPVNALVGVFLDASQPDSSAAPSALDSTNTSFTTLSPGLKQPFFIGDGLTGNGSGSVQTFIIPSGATRFFLGTSDGFGWFNNTGAFAVTVTEGGAAPTPTATPISGRTPGIPTLSTTALLALALLLAALATGYLGRRT